MKKFLGVFAVILASLSGGCASSHAWQGLQMDLNNAQRAMFRQNRDESTSVAEINRAIDRDCRSSYILPGNADSVDRSGYASCLQVNISEWMSKSPAFRDWVIRECQGRNRGHSSKCKNDELAVMEQSWHIQHEKDKKGGRGGYASSPKKQGRGK